MNNKTSKKSIVLIIISLLISLVLFLNPKEVVEAGEISEQSSEESTVEDADTTTTDLTNNVSDEEDRLLDEESEIDEVEDSPGFTEDKRQLLLEFPFESIVGFSLDVYRDRPLSEIYDSYSDKVGAIFCSELVTNQDPDYKLISNGFFISPEGHFLTTYRQINDIFNLSETDISNNRIIKLQTALSLKLIDLLVVNIDSHADLVLFQADLSQLDLDSVPFVDLAPNHRLTIGQAIFGIGFPDFLAVEGGLYPGFITEVGVTEIQESGYSMSKYKSNAVIPNTSSGSLIVDTSGHAVGISTVNQLRILSDRYSIVYPMEQVYQRLNAINDDDSLNNKASMGLIFMSDYDYANISTTFNLPAGLYITTVFVDSPAYVSDLRQNDILVSLNSTPLTSFDEFDDLLSQFVPGDAIQIEVYRPASDSYCLKTIYLN
ncbi:MAG TPA: S1C family serine protease [Candidatus Eisenbacteria bacterium]|nr:S1C family serine protease [Candidatus Eisenbacteria bacterium]